MVLLSERMLVAALVTQISASAECRSSSCENLFSTLLAELARSREAGHVSSNFREKITLVTRKHFVVVSYQSEIIFSCFCWYFFY